MNSANGAYGQRRVVSVHGSARNCGAEVGSERLLNFDLWQAAQGLMPGQVHGSVYYPRSTWAARLLAPYDVRVEPGSTTFGAAFLALSAVQTVRHGTVEDRMIAIMQGDGGARKVATSTCPTRFFHAFHLKIRCSRCRARISGVGHRLAAGGHRDPPGHHPMGPDHMRRMMGSGQPRWGRGTCRRWCAGTRT